jgi:hypothetical protein
VLHDGFVCGTWRLDRDRNADGTTLVVDHTGRLPKRAASSVAVEGRRLLRFIAPDATAHDVRLVELA